MLVKLIQKSLGNLNGKNIVQMRFQPVPPDGNTVELVLSPEEGEKYSMLVEYEVSLVPRQ